MTLAKAVARAVEMTWGDEGEGDGWGYPYCENRRAAEIGK